jgi:hypothetical protein
MKVALYTAITARKDSLKEQPVHEGVDRIFFTDRPDDYVGTSWTVHPACTIFTDPRRNSRAPKILAHQYLPEYDYSLWIDGSISLQASPLDLIETYLTDADIAMFRHPARCCLYVEAEGCANAGFDRRETFAAQVARYRQNGYPPDNGLNECAVILRRHNEQIARFNDAWWSEYCRYSCRDQISLPYVAHRLGICIAQLQGTAADSPILVYHQGHP